MGTVNQAYAQLATALNELLNDVNATEFGSELHAAMRKLEELRVTLTDLEIAQYRAIGLLD